jgi:hypothetical protein
MRNFARAHSCAKSARAKSVRANPCALRSGDFTGRAARKATKAPSRREFTSRVEGARRTFQRQSRRRRARPSAGGSSSIAPHPGSRPQGSFGKCAREATFRTKCVTQVGNLRRGRLPSRNCSFRTSGHLFRARNWGGARAQRELVWGRLNKDRAPILFSVFPTLIPVAPLHRPNYLH